jgi:cardiolipin synthase
MLELVASLSLWQWLFLAYVVWVIAAIVGILAQRRSPVATLAWILALAMLPYVGAIVYVAFGPRKLERKVLRYAAATSEVARSVVDHLRRTKSDLPFTGREAQRQLVELIDRAGEGRPTRASAVSLLADGDSCYRAIETSIDAASHHVHLEYYIWENDPVGTRLPDLLVAKARADVEVRVLVDAIGSNGLPRGFWTALRDAGGKVADFNPLRLRRLRPQLINFRSHRKIVVCDGRVGFTGGMNVSARHAARHAGSTAWRDTQLRIEGEPVRKLQRVFLEDWLFANPAARWRARDLDRYFPSLATEAGQWVQIVASGPDDDRAAIYKAYFGAITAARQRLWLTTPYFIPDEPILVALATTAQRGVDVRILVPKRGDSRLVSAASRTYYDDLVAVGIRIHEYGPPMLHAKTLVVDDDIAVVGTANIDNRSFRLNFEIIAVAYDADVTTQLAKLFERDLERARSYRKPSRRRLRRLGPVVDRFLDSLARLFSPVL